MPAEFDKRTLRERCSSHVRSRIIDGTLAPGDHLVETRLSQELGVSRGTLREALRPLEIEGLVVDDNRGHLYVRSISHSEIGQVFAVRAALESMAVETLCELSNRKTLASQLRRALKPLQNPKLSFAERLDTDLGFHRMLCELTGNEMLVRSWRNLMGHIEMMIIAAGPDRAASRMRYEDHVVIADAIGQGDVDRARAVLRAHMSDFATRYLSDAADQEVAAS